MLYVAVVEADYACMEYLKKLLIQWADKKTEIKVSIFANGKEVVDSLTSAFEYDIVFVDLSSDQNDGILAAKRLRDMGYKNLLVLTSDSNDRACEGYLVNAYRYCVKPVRREDIKECMDYAFHQKIGSFFQYTYKSVTERIAFSDIICFESFQHYIDIHTLNGVVHIKGTLKEIQKQCPVHFLRCQRSYIVNINCILSRKRKQLKLINGKVVNISSHYLEMVVDAMGG